MKKKFSPIFPHKIHKIHIKRRNCGKLCVETMLNDGLFPINLYPQEIRMYSTFNSHNISSHKIPTTSVPTKFPVPSMHMMVFAREQLVGTGTLFGNQYACMQRMMFGLTFLLRPLPCIPNNRCSKYKIYKSQKYLISGSRMKC